MDVGINGIYKSETGCYGNAHTFELMTSSAAKFEYPFNKITKKKTQKRHLGYHSNTILVSNQSTTAQVLLVYFILFYVQYM